MRYSTHHVTDEDVGAVISVLRSDWLTQGPKVREFEEALAAYCGAKYAVAVSSGTAALYLAYRAADIRRRCLVATSPMTFVATTNALLLATTDPFSDCRRPGEPAMFRHLEQDRHLLFADVDPTTGCISPATIAEAMAKVPRHEVRHIALPAHYPCAVVPVHYAGRSCGMDYSAVFPRVRMVYSEPYYVNIPDRISTPVIFIEDACHALGAMDFDGCSRVGSCAHSLATAFSFHPVKPITTGEGGAVTTNDAGFADEVRSLRSHGRDGAGLMRALSGNFRMPDINAALGLSQLKRCDEMRARRADLAERYALALCAVSGMWCPSGWFERDAWHLYPVRIKHGRRDEVKAKLNAQDIGAQVHYSPIVPLHPYYRERFGYKPGEFPEAEAWAAEELSLPLHAGMTEADVERVVAALREALK